MVRWSTHAAGSTFPSDLPRFIRARRRDGSLQVTYAGHPLYYYEGDGKSEVKCQNVSNFGGLWLLVRANGKAVR